MKEYKKMRKNLLKGFLGSAAAIALTLGNADAANPQDGGNAFANGFNFAIGYGLDLTVMTKTGQEDSDVSMKKEDFFGSDAKWKGGASNNYQNLKSQNVKLTTESYEAQDVKTYQEEIAQAQGDEEITSGLIEDQQSLGYAYKELGEDQDKRAMSHYGWLQAGYAFGFGDWVVEPTLTLKAKGSSSSRTIGGDITVYSPYLGGGSLGSEYIQVTGDNAGKVRTSENKFDAKADVGGGVLVKVGTFETTATTAKVATGDLAANDGSKAGKEEYININTADLAEMKFNGQKMTTDTGNSQKIQEFLNEQVFKLGKDANGSYLHQTVYATRDVSYELKNNFEAALHANVGYALNEYVMPYVKLGLSMDVYKLELKKGGVSFKADDAEYNPLAFTYDPANARNNLYFKPKKEITVEKKANDGDAAVYALPEKVESSDMYLLVNPTDRSGYKEVKDNKLVTDQAKLDELEKKATAELTTESISDKASKEKNTFVQLNAEFGVGIAANVYKGMQLRAEFVYALPMNKKKKMYDDTLELNMAPHKLKFNFGVVVPLNMIMGK